MAINTFADRVTNATSIQTGMNGGADVNVISGNVDSAALVTHAASAVGVASADQTNVNGRGVQVGVNITAGSGAAPTLQVVIEGKDAASGAYYPLFTSAAIAAAPGFTLLSLYPGLAASAAAANQVLPRTWRIRTVIGGAAPVVTATVGASVIV